VANGSGNCIGGDSSAEPGTGAVIGYLKTSGGPGTVPVYRSTCYSSGGVCTAWGLSLDVNGTPAGYLSATAPDGQSAADPFIQSNGLLLQGLDGTPSAYLWSAQTQTVTQTDHIYNTDGSDPAGYTSAGTTGYLELSSATGNTPLYRFVNSSTGRHYYSTTNDQPAGFTQEANLGYLRTGSGYDLVSLYRHYNATTGDYRLTTSSAPPSGYVMQANLGYIYTTAAGGSGSYQNLVYDYDPVGNITAITDNIFTASRTFAYDALNRLTSASGDFGANQAFQNCAYVYSPIGNIDNKCGVAFTYGDPMHPSAVTAISSGKTYSYDANGNMATGGGRTFTWDIDNRVTSVSIGGSTTTMEYDHTGMRVKKDGGGGLTLYPFQGYEIAPGGEITKFIRIGVETFAAKRGASKFFYHNDHLGSVNVITDGSGARCQLNEYDPWGKISRSEGGGEGIIRFTGQKLDVESGLLYYGGRYYDPELGRFISPDPFVQEMFNPQSLNRYAYVTNNPVNYIDPSGYFHRHKKQSGGFWDSIFGTILRIVFDFVMIWAGLPPGGLLLEGATIGLSAFVGLADLMQQGISALNSGGNDGMSGVDFPISGVPGSINAGGGGFFSPALQVAGQTGAVTGEQFADDRFRRIANDEGDGIGWRGPLGRIAPWTLGFPTAQQLARFLGPAGPDRVWHHIVMRFGGRNEIKFGAEKINNVLNIFNMDAIQHTEIHRALNSAVSPGGPLLRELVFDMEFATQRQFMLNMMRSYGVPNVPLR